MILSNKFFVFLSLTLLIIFFIFIKIVFGQNNGYIASDSLLYFMGAENLILNKSLFFDEELIFNNFAIPNLKGNGYLFAIQPPAYIFLISIISGITNLDIFWSSKLLNFISVAGIFYILRFYIFHSNLISIFVLFNSSFLEVFSYSLIEPLFIFLLCFNIIILYKFLKSKKNKISFIFLIILSSYLISFSRYNGMLILPCIILLAVYCIFYLKQINKGIILIIISFVLFIGIISWLYFVYENTGLLTGFSRGIREDIFYYFLYSIRSIIIETNYLLSSTWNLFGVSRNDLLSKLILFIIFYIIQFIPIYFFYEKMKIKLIYFLPNKKNFNLNIVLLIFIVCFTIPIFLIHITTMIDPINFRTISPISFMLIILFLISLKVNLPQQTKKILRNYSLYLISISILLNIFSQVYFIGYNL